MRFATIEHGGAVRAAVVTESGVHPFAAGLTVLQLVQSGLPAALDAGWDAAAGMCLPLADVRFLAPLEPPSVRDFVAFEEHVEGVRKSVDGVAGVPDAWYDAPRFYFTNPHALIGTGDEVCAPPGCELLDYELEVALVVGVDGGDLTPAAARKAVFGYSVLNDWSARDLQSREMKMGLGPAKGKDFASTLGPWIVTADEIEAHRDDEGYLQLAMTVEVNGVETGRDLLSNMGWPFEELLAYASIGTTVRAGDVLGSGTCGNGGCLAELWGRSGRQEPPPLVAGDTVTMSVQGIGTITNTVGRPRPAVSVARARPRPRSRP